MEHPLEDFKYTNFTFPVHLTFEHLKLKPRTNLRTQNEPTTLEKTYRPKPRTYRRLNNGKTIREPCCCQQAPEPRTLLLLLPGTCNQNAAANKHLQPERNCK